MAIARYWEARHLIHEAGLDGAGLSVAEALKRLAGRIETGEGWPDALIGDDGVVLLEGDELIAVLDAIVDGGADVNEIAQDLKSRRA